MNEVEWNIYREWFLWVSENFVPRPQGFIYLRTSPEVAYQRIVRRHRHEESGVSLAYVKRLHDKHDDWLIRVVEPIASIKDVPVLVLDCDQDFESNTHESACHLTAIRNFIDSLDKKNQIAPGALRASGHSESVY